MLLQNGQAFIEAIGQLIQRPLLAHLEREDVLNQLAIGRRVQQDHLNRRMIGNGDTARLADKADHIGPLVFHLGRVLPGKLLDIGELSDHGAISLADDQAYADRIDQISNFS
ncbi:hypothetical protein [Oleomonas cavernae]|uniref:hypothetical protein n=1 Tax=Oleomonas cavernae TaxID=2320859 RepID=UPI001313FCBB|nr:hypothetical protein [Oleomonas cavernae]